MVMDRPVVVHSSVCRRGREIRLGVTKFIDRGKAL